MGSGLAGGPLTGGPAAAPSLLPGATGTDLTLSGNATAAAFIPTGSTVPTNGIYLPTANSVGIATSSTASLTFRLTGFISSPGLNTNLAITETSTTISGSAGNIQRWTSASGLLSILGTDSSGTPGAATIDKPTGKSAIAIGAASVVITNALVTAATRVMITPQSRDATCKELIAVPGAGSFTVSGSANATAALVFSWEVSNII